MNYFAIPGLMEKKTKLIPNLNFMNIVIPQSRSSNPGRRKGVTNKEVQRRSAICHLLQGAGWGYKKLAKQFNVSNHTTILSGVKRFRGLLYTKDEEAVAIEAELRSMMYMLPK